MSKDLRFFFGIHTALIIIQLGGTPMKHLINHRNFPAILFILFFCNLLLGCYQLKEIPKSDIISYEDKEYVVLVSEEKRLELQNPSISDNQLHGIPYAVHSNYDLKQRKIVEVFVPTFDQIIRHDTSNMVSIPFEHINRAEVHDLRLGATIVSIGLGVTALTVLIVAIVDDGDSKPKRNPPPEGQSCPFIFIKNGNTQHFVGEIYAGATHSCLERHDYLTLQKFTPTNNSYSLMMANYLQEIQYTNLLELFVFDHPKETNLLVDKYGNHHTFSNPVTAIDATDKMGKSIAFELKEQDNIKHLSDLTHNTSIIEPIYLSFNRPKHCKTAKLIIKGKNTTWLEHTMGQYIDGFGKKHQKWNNRKLLKFKDEIRQWQFDQSIPLSVYLKSNNKWQFVDYFQVSGSIIDKMDILNLDITKATSELIEIKLVTGSLFWELDYVAMDFSENITVEKSVIPASEAFDLNKQDALKYIQHDDKKYLIQADIGNEVNLSFPTPSLKKNFKRSIILHSKGYYKVINDASGKPDKEFIMNSSNPSHFTKFSKDKFDELYQKNGKQ